MASNARVEIVVAENGWTVFVRQHNDTVNGGRWFVASTFLEALGIARANLRGRHHLRPDQPQDEDGDASDAYIWEGGEPMSELDDG